MIPPASPCGVAIVEHTGRQFYIAGLKGSHRNTRQAQDYACGQRIAVLTEADVKTSVDERGRKPENISPQHSGITFGSGKIEYVRHEILLNT